MSILEGLFFGSQRPFDEVDMNCPEYYRMGDKVDKIKAEILEKYPDLEQLMEEYANAQMEQTELGRFHEFSVGVRVGSQLMLEMLKELQTTKSGIKQALNTFMRRALYVLRFFIYFSESA